MRYAPLACALVALLTGCASDNTATVATGSPAAPASPPLVALDPSTPLGAVGIPTYPGSTKVEITLSKPAKNGSKTVYAEYSSTDFYEKVVQFYQDKLGLQVGQFPGKVKQLVGKTPKNTFVQILVGPNADKSKIQYYFILPAANSIPDRTAIATQD